MPAKSATDEPEVTLMRWAFVRHIGIGYRIVGIRPGHGPRISSRIASYDDPAKTAVTESGRVYRLQGDPDHITGHAIAWAYAMSHGIPKGDFESVSIADVMLALEPQPTRGMN